MVGNTTNNQHPSLQLAPPSSTTSPEEDEILKRNTDCVYFLASPLTCKKGSECEYRHSDVARVNPRDCFYWLNGNCLNPKCAFRHPPLDGLVGDDGSTPVGPSAPAPHPASYVTPKQGVACIFFQKGFCLKGHLCPFLHGPPNSINHKPTQSVSANPIPDPPKTVYPIPEKPVQEQKFTQYSTVQKAPFSARNGVDKMVALPPARVVPPLVMDEPSLDKPNHSGIYQGYHVSETDRTVNVKDADEYSREPSPGFDVLVDNEVEDSEYPREKDEFGRSRGHDYDVDHVDRDMYREHRDYDHFNEREGHFDVDRVERKPYFRNDRENESDLRHRLSKQRRSSGSDNGLRSVVSREYGRENHGSHHYRPDHRQDHRPDPGTVSSRLRGRIQIPGRSISPTNGNNSRVEREIQVERKHLSRYSPGRPISLNQSRLRDRITGQRDTMSDSDSNFSGPKRLAELKRHQSNEEQSLGKRKYPKAEDSSSFEGPKPLSEILKRKRGVNNYTNNNNDNDINISAVNTKERETVPANKEEQNPVLLDIEEQNEKDKPVDGNSVNYGTSEVEIKQGSIDEDALLDEELEGYDDENKDGEYEYEQIEGEEEDYNLDEGEYVEEEEKDGEEFGKKDSVVYS